MKKKNIAKNELKKWLLKAEKIAIIGIGNPILMDDSVGIKVVQDLRGKVPDKVLLIECETTPENHLQEIMIFKPTHILIVDASMLNLKPGGMVLLEPRDLKINHALSTHFLPIKLFCEYIANISGAEVKLLLIQPKQIDLGEELSPEVLSSKEGVVKILLSTFLTRNNKLF